MNPQLMNILSMLSGGYDTEDEEFRNWLKRMSMQQRGRNPMMMAGLNDQPMPVQQTHRTPLNVPGKIPLEPPFRTNPQGPVRNMIPPMRG